jgi:hypothetical protein
MKENVVQDAMMLKRLNVDLAMGFSEKEVVGGPKTEEEFKGKKKCLI